MGERDGLEASRQRVEDALRGLRSSLPAAIAGPTRRKAWLVPMLAAAVGMALALSVRRRRARRDRAAD